MGNHGVEEELEALHVLPAVRQGNIGSEVFQLRLQESLEFPVQGNRKCDLKLNDFLQISATALTPLYTVFACSERLDHSIVVVCEHVGNAREIGYGTNELSNRADLNVLHPIQLIYKNNDWSASIAQRSQKLLALCM